MGIITKQGIKGTIWSYLGLIIGYLNLGIIMPHVFSPGKIGLIHLFVATSTIFSQFSSLGFNSVTNRMFPYFRDRMNKHNGFLFLAISITLIGFTLATVAFFILKPHIIEANIQTSPIIVEYIMLLLPLIFFKLMYSLFNTYNRVLLDSVTGVFWSEFVHRIVNLLLIIGVALDLFNFRQFFFGYIVSICMPVIPIIFVLIKRGDFSLKPNLGYVKKYTKEMISISAYGMFNGFSGQLTSNIDKLLVHHYLSLQSLGIFSVCSLFAKVISIPGHSVSSISTGLIAQSWKENNVKHIQEIYYKASITQMVVGSILFIGLLINIDTIFQILPAAYSKGKWVIIIYAFGVLVSTVNSMNGTIISTSARYKALSYFVILTFAISIISSVLLIPPFGIIGAAIATSLTYIIINAAKFLFIKINFGMNCFGKKHLIVLFIAIPLVLLGNVLSGFDNWIINFVFKSSIISAIYIALIWKLNVSEDITKLLNVAWQSVLKLKK
ncbi:MAG: polysaccharide biosynthesis C-terminal domain-containing protein [Bacteroidetes bacterium]|nr:polysaccharide biosynthesis C-terminal domain-containing protein [Bacteroidota bacterium]